MVFGVSHVTVFFKDNDQMGLSRRTHMHLQSEGIVRPNNLIYFTASGSCKQIIDNCKRPARITDPNNAGQIIAQEDFQFPTQSLMRLKVSDVAVEYYSKTSRPLDVANILWDQRLKNLQVEIISLLEQKKGSNYASLPIISNKLIISNFFEVYDTFSGDCIRKNECPINCVLRKDVVVGMVNTLSLNQPYSSTHGLVEEEMIQRFAHSCPFYKGDNDAVYFQLVIATLVSQYSSMIAPF